MKITALKIRELDGILEYAEHPEPFWEERLVRPVDIYPRFRAEGASNSNSLGDGRYAMRSAFLEIHTDESVTGLSGPISRHEAFIIDTQLRPILEGADALAGELLWDQMYRSMIHGRKGETMMAISAVDCGLWDLKGQGLRPAPVPAAGRPDQAGDPGLRQRPGILDRARAGRP